MAHSLLERFGLLLLPPLLENGVMFADDQSAVFMPGFDALLTQDTSGARGGLPFKAVGDAAGGFLLQGTALAVGLSARTNRGARFHRHLEIFAGETPVVV